MSFPSPQGDGVKPDTAARIGSDDSVAEDAVSRAKPLVSVIIATHNRAHCLPRALDTIYAQEGLGQSFDIEVIVVDDASSDATFEVIAGYSRVRYIRFSERRGVSAAMNEGLRASRGCYIGFLDDDDEWLAHKLRVQVPLLEAHPEVGVVYGQSVLRRGEEDRLIPSAGHAPSGRVFLPMLMENFCGHHACLLVRRSAFDKAGYFDESLATYEDWDLSLRLAFHVAFLFAPGAVDIYNLSPQGLWLTRAASGAGAEDAARVIEKALSMLPDLEQYAEVRQEARARMVLETASRLGNTSEAWARVVAALCENPRLLHRTTGRELVASVFNNLAFPGGPSVAAARQVCSKIKAATRSWSLRDRWLLRQLVALIWVQTARSLILGPRTNGPEGVYATACALSQAPMSLPAHKVMLRVIVRTLLGRRVDELCMRFYKRVKRMTFPRQDASRAS
jgi:glycosyl transferase family 2